MSRLCKSIVNSPSLSDNPEVGPGYTRVPFGYSMALRSPREKIFHLFGIRYAVSLYTVRLQNPVTGGFPLNVMV